MFEVLNDSGTFFTPRTFDQGRLQILSGVTQQHVSHMLLAEPIMLFKGFSCTAKSLLAGIKVDLAPLQASLRSRFLT